LKSSLIILTFNEIEGVKHIYDRIPMDSVGECFVVDAGSTDGTIEFFKKKGIKVVIQKRRGRGDAFKEGMINAKGEYLVFFSPDGNEDPKDIPNLLTWLDRRYDMIIASRFMKGAKSEDAGFIRGIGNKIFTFLVNLFWDAKVTDVVNGLRAIKKSTLKKLNLDFKKFEIELQMTIRTAKLNYKIKEIPTYEGKRIGGKSKAKTIDTGLLYLKTIFRELLIGKNF
jgi:glycosyltransferase involved in cell wall biosynthesis